MNVQIAHLFQNQNGYVNSNQKPYQSGYSFCGYPSSPMKDTVSFCGRKIQIDENANINLEYITDKSVETLVRKILSKSGRYNNIDKKDLIKVLKYFGYDDKPDSVNGSHGKYRNIAYPDMFFTILPDNDIDKAAIKTLRNALFIVNDTNGELMIEAYRKPSDEKIEDFKKRTQKFDRENNTNKYRAELEKAKTEAAKSTSENTPKETTLTKQQETGLVQEKQEEIIDAYEQIQMQETVDVHLEYIDELITEIEETTKRFEISNKDMEEIEAQLLKLNSDYCAKQVYFSKIKEIENRIKEVKENKDFIEISKKLEKLTQQCNEIAGETNILSSENECQSKLFEIEQQLNEAKEILSEKEDEIIRIQIEIDEIEDVFNDDNPLYKARKKARYERLKEELKEISIRKQKEETGKQEEAAPVKTGSGSLLPKKEVPDALNNTETVNKGKQTELTTESISDGQTKEIYDGKAVLPHIVLPVSKAGSAMINDLISREFTEDDISVLKNCDIETFKEMLNGKIDAVLSQNESKQIIRAANIVFLDEVYLCQSEQNQNNDIYSLKYDEINELAEKVLKGEKSFSINTKSKGKFDINLAKDINFKNIDERVEYYAKPLSENEIEPVETEIFKYYPNMRPKEKEQARSVLLRQSKYMKFLTEDTVCDSLKITLLKLFWSDYDEEFNTRYAADVEKSYNLKKEQKIKFEQLSNMDFSNI